MVITFAKNKHKMSKYITIHIDKLDSLLIPVVNNYMGAGTILMAQKIKEKLIENSVLDVTMCYGGEPPTPEDFSKDAPMEHDELLAQMDREREALNQKMDNYFDNEFEKSKGTAGD